MSSLLIILALVLLCPIYATGAAAAELQLDNDVLYQNRGSDASITDRYGISVFSDAVNETAQANETADRQKNEQLRAELFKNESLGTTAGSSIVRQQSEDMGLFSQSDPDTYEEQARHGVGADMLKTVGAIAVAVVLLLTYMLAAKHFKRMRRRDRKNVFDTDGQNKGWK
ncbi:MAG: hypothetical protein VB031_09570 [Eubacteriaceae bacterium]|nr:hypothetical protein [Eubacteriaceae bacterium]